MIAATPLAQDPRPTLVGERVNSQGSRKAKELLLADDYDGLVQVAEDQVEGGAHVLDLCVALTERQDEDEQMRRVAKSVSLTQPAPIQVDSTEPEVIETALDQIPGRAIVNSVNLEAGRAKLDRVTPIALAHGAALIALTIDEVGMAKTRERKLEVARRIHDLVCGEHGMDPQLLIFDALTFTLTTGDDEWKPSAVETIEGIRLIKAELPGVLTSLGVSNVSFGIGLAARAVLNSVFLHHCVEAGLDLAMVNPNHITPYGEIDAEERGLADDLVFNRRDDALERFIAHFEEKAAHGDEAEAADPTADMEPEDALHWHILRRKKDGVEVQIDAAVEKLGAVPTLNDVLLPAMKEVGDLFGAGELILPFVLQSAEVMKRAVARLELYLDKLEGYTKGTVVLATVFGDVHDIGKSLVNTILTNNGYTVVDLGKQVPIGTILEAAREHEATAIGLSALLVSTSKQMPLCVQELHAHGDEFPLLVGGAAINRKFGLRANYPDGKESDAIYAPGVFYCKDAFEGLAVMDQLVDGDAREQLVAKVREDARRLREEGETEVVLNLTDDSVRSPVATDNPVPGAAVLGRARDPRRPRRGLPASRHARPLQAPLGRARREGRGLAPAGRGRLPSAAGAHVARAGLPAPARAARLLPLLFRGQRDRGARPRGPLHGARAPGRSRASRPATASAWPTSSGRRRPATLDVVALQAVTAGDEVTELMAQLERDGEFAEQLFTHGLGVADRRGDGRMAALARARRPRHPRDAGPALLVGLPGDPRAVRAREGLPPARRHGADRAAAVRRLRGRARAVDAGADRPPSRGDLLRDHERAPAARRPQGPRRRRHQGLAARPVALRRDRRRRAGTRRRRIAA